MKTNKDILLSYYGDDFTGSSDVMEVLSLMGIPTILFLEAPTPREIDAFKFKKNHFKEARQMAFGVAGIARSLGPVEMKKELDPIFEKLSRIESRYFHYKVCSTLDSSPVIGNIGLAMEVAEKYFPNPFIPLLLGFPTLNRFVVFGNLFARIKETVYRLDRHPVMSKHPITPMDESDIRLHLKKQTNRDILLVDVMQLEKLEKLSSEELISEKSKENGSPMVLFDTLENRHLVPIGKWLDKNCRLKHQFLVGSSAVEYALGHVYGLERQIQIKPLAVQPTLIVSGSCAQTTSDQIMHVEKLGYTCIRLEVNELYSSKQAEKEMERVIKSSIKALEDGKNTLIFSALGPEDPKVKTTLDQQRAMPKSIAACQGWITAKITESFPLKRLVTAGGDTSGYVLKALGIHALEFTNVLAPGSPLCTAHAANPEVDGMEIAIKGGQNGTIRYFEFAQRGGIIS